MGITLGEINVNIRVDNSRFNADLGQAEAAGNRFSRNISDQATSAGSSIGTIGGSIGNAFSSVGSVMQSAGESIKNVGENLTKYITLPLAAATTAVFKFGKDFESELSKVVGLVGVSQKQVNEWGTEILEMAPKLGKAPRELADALFFITSAGIKGAEAMDVLEMSAKGSAAGLGETKTIADLVTSAMNAYGKENLSAAQAVDIVTMAVRQGKAEASELASSMGQVLPLASEMGVTFDQVAATQAAMTKTGTGAAEAATQLKSILAGMIKPSKQAEEQLKAMGTSSAEMRKSIREKGLLNALMDLKDLTNKYGEEAMARVYPNIRALMGVLDLMGANLEDNKKVFSEVTNSTGTLDDAFKSASQTLDFKWNQAISKVQATAISFFDILKARLMPVLERFISILDWVAKKFQSLSPSIQNIILLIAGIAAIIGPAMVVLGTLIAGVGSAIAGLGTVISVVSAVIGTVGVPVFAAIAGIIAVVIGVIAGLVASFVLLWKTNEDFRNKVTETWNSIKTNAVIIFNEIKKTVIYIFEAIQRFWKEHGDSITKFLKGVWIVIMDIVKFAMEFIKGTIKFICAIIRGDWSAAFEAIKGIIKAALNLIISLVKNYKDIFVGLWKTIGTLVLQAIKSMVTRIIGFWKEVFNAGKGLGTQIIKALASIDFVKSGVKIVKGIISGIKSMLGSLGNTVTDMVSVIRNKLPFSPAKEGPLSDLDKIDFYSSINKALMSAKSRLNIPTIKLGQEIMDNISQSPSFNLGNGNQGNKNLSFNGPMNFYGIEDTYSLMKELRSVITRYSGRMI